MKNAFEQKRQNIFINIIDRIIYETKALEAALPKTSNDARQLSEYVLEARQALVSAKEVAIDDKNIFCVSD